MPFRGKKEKSGMPLFAQPKSGMPLGLKLSIVIIKASPLTTARLLRLPDDQSFALLGSIIIDSEGVH
jgi:hypothetical protein